MKFTQLPIWPFVLAAFLCLSASVFFTAQDSPWRWVGFVGALGFVVLTACAYMLRPPGNGNY